VELCGGKGYRLRHSFSRLQHLENCSQGFQSVHSVSFVVRSPHIECVDGGANGAKPCEARRVVYDGFVAERRGPGLFANLQFYDFTVERKILPFIVFGLRNAKCRRTCTSNLDAKEEICFPPIHASDSMMLEARLSRSEGSRIPKSPGGLRRSSTATAAHTPIAFHPQPLLSIRLSCPLIPMKPRSHAKQHLDELARLAKHPKVIAWGESALDLYYYDQFSARGVVPSTARVSSDREMAACERKAEQNISREVHHFIGPSICPGLKHDAVIILCSSRTGLGGTHSPNQ